MVDSGRFRSGKAGILPLLAAALGCANFFLGGCTTLLAPPAKASQTIFVPTTNGVQARTVHTGGEAKAEGQQRPRSSDPVAMQLFGTPEGAIIPELAALKDRSHDLDALDYTGSYIAPIAVLGIDSVDRFNNRAGTGFVKMRPGSICNHIDKLMKQVASGGMEYCEGYERNVVNLIDPSQSSSESIRYFSLLYTHSGFVEAGCVDICRPIAPFSRAQRSDLYCGYSLYHVFRARNGIEYRIIGNLDARKYPIIDFFDGAQENAGYLKSLQKGRGLTGAEKAQCKILVEQEKERIRVPAK